VIESARELLAARGVADRVELSPGSFFERVPGGCDAYIIKNVLHDWDDATCRKILGVVRAAMSPGQRLIVCEILVDRLARDAHGTRVDLHMMIACDQGRERSEEELRALLAECGFRTTRVFPFPIVSMIEAEPV
jgi:C-methyltransferase